MQTCIHTSLRCKKNKGAKLPSMPKRRDNVQKRYLPILKRKKKITQAYDHEGVQCWFKPGFKGKTMQETSKAMRRDS